MGKLILVLGGARSGKSSFAEKLAWQLGKEEVTYLATATCQDEEMERRIEIHKNSRPRIWPTVEEAKEVAKAILQESSNTKVLLLDCLTLLVTNLLLDENLPAESKEQVILQEIRNIAINSKEGLANVIVVSNEVGLGLVPTYPLGREYRDVAGRANQLMASFADEVYFTIAGIPVELKSLGKKLEEEIKK